MREGRTFITIILITLIVLSSLGLYYIYQYSSQSKNVLNKFSDVNELIGYLYTHVEKEYYGGYGILPLRATLEAAGAKAAEATSQNTPLGYSLTNTQVEGIDEADYVKTDGEYIYLVHDNQMNIIDVSNPEDPTLLSTIKLINKSVSGIYIYGKKLVLLTAAYFYYPVLLKEEVSRSSSPGKESIEPSPKKWMYASEVDVYDLNNPSDPVLVKNVTFPGLIKTTRLMNGILYVIVNEPIHIFVDNDKKPDIPFFVIDGVNYTIPVEEIYYSDVNDYGYQYTIIFTLDLDNFQYDYLTILTGYTNLLYMSYSNIYLTQNIWRGYNEGYLGYSMSITRIYRFKIDGLKVLPEAVGEVPGIINDRLQLDEYNGYLRVSTYGWEIESTGTEERMLSYTNIYVLNMNLTIVGSISKIAESEVLYATRYSGDYAYLVTFRRVDPLFVIDLSNPREPKIVGKLKIPGFSTMLQPLWDNLVIGIGYEVDNQTRILGLKVSLFDVSDPLRPVEIGKLVFNESRYACSEASRDIHAILRVPFYNYVGIPVNSWKTIYDEEKNLYMSVPVSAYLVMNASRKGLKLVDLLEIDYSNATCVCYPYYIRGLYIGNNLFVVTNLGISVYNLDNLERVSILKI